MVYISVDGVKFQAIGALDGCSRLFVSTIFNIVIHWFG